MKETILVVDDDHVLRKAINSVLHKKYLVVECNDGAEAMQWIEKHPTPALVLLDLMMPTINGFDFIRYLKAKKDKANIPIVVVSFTESMEQRKLCGELGVQDFLKKPINLFQLDIVIQKVFLNVRMSNLEHLKSKYSKPNLPEIKPNNII
jgi:CheY-like chemotaxis protein